MFIYDDLNKLEETNDYSDLAVTPLTYVVLDCDR